MRLAHRVVMRRTHLRRRAAWEPKIGLREGIERTIDYFAQKVTGP